MISSVAGGFPGRTGARSDLLDLNTSLSASVDTYNQSFGTKLKTLGEGRIIMHFFLEEQGNILHTLGLKVQNFMGPQPS